MNNKEKNKKGKLSENKSLHKAGSEKNRVKGKSNSIEKNGTKLVSSFMYQANPESKKKNSSIKYQLQLLQSSTCCENQSFNLSYRSPQTTQKKQHRKERCELIKGNQSNIEDGAKLSKSFYKPQEKNKKSDPRTKQNESKRSKNSGYELENQRIQMLKLYIQEDSNRHDKLKQVRDEHILHELSYTQKNLQKLLQDRNKPFGGDPEFSSGNQRLKVSQQQQISGLEREVKKLKQELSHERELNENMEKRALEYEQQINRFRSLLSTKELDNTLVNTKRIQDKSESIFDLGRQAQGLKQRVKFLEAQRNQLIQKLEKRQYQCETIKKEAKLVLQIIQQQMRQF